VKRYRKGYRGKIIQTLRGPEAYGLFSQRDLEQGKVVIEFLPSVHFPHSAHDHVNGRLLLLKKTGELLP